MLRRTNPRTVFGTVMRPVFRQVFDEVEAPPQIITATVEPTAYAYSDGDVVNAHPSFATLDNTANYSSTAGTITSVEWLVDGTDQAGTYTLSAGQGVVIRVTDSEANTRDWTIDASVDAVVPAQFNTNHWSLSNDGVSITLTVSTLPDDGGSALTDLEYKVNAGSYTSLGAATTGAYTITASEGDSVYLRAVNAVGNGPDSAAKTVPASGAPLDLNFATGTYVDNASNTTLATIATFARSSSATYMDSSGAMQTASSGTIRDAHHEWNGISWVRKGLLLETDAATNLIPNSEDMTTWLTFATGSVTVTSNSATGPDGLTSLDKVAISDATYESHGLYQHFTVTSGAAYTLSAFVSNGGQRYIGLRNLRANGAWSTVIFDLQTGTSTQQTSGTSGTLNDYGIIDYGSGLYRVWISTTETGTTLTPYIFTVSSGTPTLTSSDGRESYSGTAGVFFNCGFTQLEAGTFPSSYIPTSGATATRAGETLSVNAASLPESATGQSIVINFEASYVDDGLNHLARNIFIWGSTDFIRLGLGTIGGLTGYPIAGMKNGGSLSRANYNSTTDVYSPGYRVPMHLGVRCNSSGYIEVVADGSTLSAPQTVAGAYPTLTGEIMELFSAGTVDLNGTISRLRVWDSDIGQADLLTETA